LDLVATATGSESESDTDTFVGYVVDSSCEVESVVGAYVMGGDEGT
jgi:hypothetical protein